ncbi:hypothetical protein [Kitasatospora sp. NPDC096204]|uniref:hypothetical protein n=1 Tax=Kitasatospora sp. NPDC096204 TaxID=3364094 RepID=UPI0037F987A4
MSNHADHVTGLDARRLGWAIGAAAIALLGVLIARLAQGDISDLLGLGLLALALLVLCALLVSPDLLGDFEVGGIFKVKRIKDLEEGMKTVSKTAFRGILGKHERAHLRKLNGQEEDRVDYQQGLKQECERLEALGYLRAKDGNRGLQAMKDEEGKGGFPLEKYASITDDGKEYLDLYAKVAPEGQP